MSRAPAGASPGGEQSLFAKLEGSYESCSRRGKPERRAIFLAKIDGSYESCSRRGKPGRRAIVFR